MDGMMPTFTELLCPDCQGSEFSRVFGLVTRANSGTVETPKGYLCVTCQKKVDLSEMQAQQELGQLEREVADRRARMETLKTHGVA